jgi:hypothetical protein
MHVNKLIMRRRRLDILTDDIKSEVKSVLGKLLFWLVKSLVAKLVDMLVSKNWVQVDGENEYE